MESLKIITFCLWGNIPRYNIGAIRNASLALKYYPDFECWFYIHAPSVPQETIISLKQFSNSKVILKYSDNIIPNRFMSWRFEAIDDPRVEIMMSRDTDTRILKREADAVREWMKSGKTFHIMRDHPCHFPKILGGMFGTKKISQVPNFTSAIKLYFDLPSNSKNTDQSFLQDKIYPLIKDNCIIHDEFMKYEGEQCKNFPIKFDEEYHFVGEYVFEDEKRDDHHTNLLKGYLQARIPHRIQHKMNIKYCVMSCDIDCEYLKYFSLIKWAWKSLDIDIKLILVDKEIPNNLKEFKNDIIVFNPIENIPVEFQSRCIKYIYPSLLNTCQGVITTDINIIPICKFHVDYTTDNFVIYENDMFRCLATPDVWKNIFEIKNISDIEKTIKKLYLSSEKYKTDRLIIFNHINKQNNNVVITTNKKYNKLDIKNVKNLNDMKNTKININLGMYSDFLLPMPFDIYKNIVSKLMSKLIVGIDRIYILHYTKLVERKKNMMNQIGIFDGLVPVVWIDQFDREKVDKNTIDKVYSFDPSICPRYLTIGEICNAIGHMYIIEQSLKNNEIQMTIEDDMIFKNDFIKNLIFVMKNVPSDKDIIAIGGHYVGDGVNNDINFVSEKIDIIRPTKSETPTGAFIITPQASFKIMSSQKYSPIHSPIDTTLTFITVKMKVYWCRPWLAVEGSKELGLFHSSFERGF
jgi:GR25 family glycosyltransferase involved in LPS biosynthesis